MTKIEKLNQIFEDSAVMEQVSTLRDPDEIRAVLEEHGLTLSAQELDEILLAVGESVSQLMPEGELSEDDLEDVAGGVSVTILLGAGAKILCGVAGGLVGVAAVAALAYGGYVLYKKYKKK